VPIDTSHLLTYTACYYCITREMSTQIIQYLPSSKQPNSLRPVQTIPVFTAREHG